VPCCLLLIIIAYRGKQQAAKASKVVVPPGPGRGKGPRKSNAGPEDISLGGDGLDEDEEDEELNEQPLTETHPGGLDENEA
jgi:hypothetical protein